MKCIGILGGMSPSSTELYYRQLNDKCRLHRGGLHSADCLVRSVDFAHIAELQQQGNWELAGSRLAEAAKGLEVGGAELLVLATNTMHKVAPAIKDAITIPFLDIFSCTAEAILKAGCSRPALIATAYTMEQDFCLGRLREVGLDPRVPGPEDRETVHRIIFEELCIGKVVQESSETFQEITRGLLEKGADSVILGCTEVGMLLNEHNVNAPVFDTTIIHCDAALAVATQGVRH